MRPGVRVATEADENREAEEEENDEDNDDNEDIDDDSEDDDDDDDDEAEYTEEDEENSLGQAAASGSEVTPPPLDGWRLALALLESMGGQTGAWAGLDGIDGVDASEDEDQCGGSDRSARPARTEETDFRDQRAQVAALLLAEAPDLSCVLPDALSYEAVVVGCCEAGRWREAAKLLQSMAEDSHHAIVATTAAAKAAASARGGYQGPRGVQPPPPPLQPTERSVAAVVDACERAGEWQFAAEVRERTCLALFFSFLFGTLPKTIYVVQSPAHLASTIFPLPA
jgi:pentatricopeptide repeat protein